MSLTLSIVRSLPKPSAKDIIKNVLSTHDSQAQCLVALVDNKGEFLGDDKALTQLYADRIKNLITASNFAGKLGETVADFALSVDSKKAPLQLLLVGIGDTRKLSASNLQKVASAIYKNTHKRIESLVIAIDNTLSRTDCEQFSLALLNASYRFETYKSEKSSSKLSNVKFLSTTLQQSVIDYMAAVHRGQSFARNMANEPGNVCFPTYLAEQAQKLAQAYPDLLKVTILGEEEMATLGMNCFLSVSKGSAREGQLVLMEYQGKSKFSADPTLSYQEVLKDSPFSVTPDTGFVQSASKSSARLINLLKSKADPVTAQPEPLTIEPDEDAPIVLVGKGVTFDSGGISIKPGAAMDEMKFDMGGAASVIGTIKALCESRLPINVVGALACAENMPSSDATRPGDIVTAMNGKTVEILNTDAEGRLVLCDTLCYVQRYRPRVIIDVATLTGACVIALGHVRSALYCNDETVLFKLEDASEQSGDLIWHMPLDDAYQSQLDSPIADIQNIGGRPAGSITAACFLSRFVEEGQSWAHLDIAGTAWNSGKEKAGTGRPVPLFMRYLKNMV